MWQLLLCPVSGFWTWERMNIIHLNTIPRKATCHQPRLMLLRIYGLQVSQPSYSQHDSHFADQGVSLQRRQLVDVGLSFKTSDWKVWPRKTEAVLMDAENDFRDGAAWGGEEGKWPPLPRGCQGLEQSKHEGQYEVHFPNRGKIQPRALLWAAL